MTLNRRFESNHVLYSADSNSAAQTIDFVVENPKKKTIPENLYKHYCINDLTIDALINHYLYAPHPMSLNDKYDCCGELIDYSNLSLDTYITRLSKELNVIPESRIRELYNPKDNWVLGRAMADLHNTILFFKFGLISLTEEPSNPLMWAHYSKNTGIAVKFKTSALPKDFFGPFPINYSKTLESIDISKNEPALCFLYLSNIKNEIWEYENEWRYLTYNRNGKYHPIYSSIDSNSRKYPYNPSAIESIILGYEFFSPREIDYKMRTNEYDIMHISNKKCRKLHKQKRKILHFLIKNSIPCFQIVRNRYSYQLQPVEIKIEALSINRFKVYNSFKTVF